MFIYADGGRSKSNYPSEINDCTVRAVAIAFSIDYNIAHVLLMRAGRKYQCEFNLKLFLNSLNSVAGIAFRILKPKEEITAEQFNKKFSAGSFILSLSRGQWRHSCALLDGDFYDIISGYETCKVNYYVKLI